MTNYIGKLHCTAVFLKIGISLIHDFGHFYLHRPVLKIYAAGHAIAECLLFVFLMLFIFKELYSVLLAQVLLELEEGVRMLIEAEIDIGLGVHENHVFFTV